MPGLGGGRWADWWARHQTYGILVLATFVFGGIAGALALDALGGADRLALVALVKSFLNLVSERSPANIDLLGIALLTNLKVLGLIYVMGVSVAGLPLILLAIFFRGFVLGFAVGFLLGTLHSVGMGLALIAVVLPNLVLVPAWLATGTGGVAFSWQLLAQRNRLASWRLSEAFLQYTVVALVGAVEVGVGSALQALLAPTVLHWLAPWGL
jgi:stage II sporulation protein M